ncbi:Protein of unknown function, partial [Gryllus bimaculatus]
AAAAGATAACCCCCWCRAKVGDGAVAAAVGVAVATVVDEVVVAPELPALVVEEVVVVVLVLVALVEPPPPASVAMAISFRLWLHSLVRSPEEADSGGIAHGRVDTCDKEDEPREPLLVVSTASTIQCLEIKTEWRDCDKD